jgi:hypothetical protein
MAHINLHTEPRAIVDTATAADYLNYSIQTLLRWARKGTGPIQPVRIEGARKLQWRVADIRKIVGGEA